VLTIVVSGPQATGKTTLAMALGTVLGVPVFSRDPLMLALQAGGRPWAARRRWVPAAGLRLQTALLARQLELGQSAILECIAPPAARQEWRRISAAAGGRFLSVEWRHELGRGHALTQVDWQQMERQARLYRNVQILLIPGLLQTPDYARYRALDGVSNYGATFGGKQAEIFGRFADGLMAEALTGEDARSLCMSAARWWHSQ
jgi:Domain of unknown function (DUF5753)